MVHKGHYDLREGGGINDFVTIALKTLVLKAWWCDEGVSKNCQKLSDVIYEQHIIDNFSPFPEQKQDPQPSTNWFSFPEICVEKFVVNVETFALKWFDFFPTNFRGVSKNVCQSRLECSSSNQMVSLTLVFL